MSSCGSPSRASTTIARSASRSAGRFFGSAAGGRGHGPDLRFLWSGDTAGQGLGHQSGLRRHEDLRGDAPAQPAVLHPQRRHDLRRRPHSPPRSSPGTGQVWTNIVTPEVAKVAETLDEFRGRYRYNLLDENVRRFNARGAADLAVGRSRRDEQLVRREGSVGRQPLQREERPAARRARRAGLPRVRADAPLRRARVAARLPPLQLRPAARPVRDRHAVVSRSQFDQPADDARAPRRRSSAASSSNG